MKDIEFLKTKLIAYRGVYDNKNVYENSLEAIAATLNKGLIINLCTNITKDGVVIVYHDADLARLMNLKDRIETSTYEELSFLSSYHIPTFKEVLKLINGSVPIIVNPKGKKHTLLKEISKELDEYSGLFAILSHHSSIIKWFNKQKPTYIIGEIITKKKFSDFFDFLAHFSIITDFKSINVEDFPIPKIKEFMMSNLVLGYLINTPDKYLKYKDICSNLFIDNILELNI